MAPRKAKSPEPTAASTRTPRSTRKSAAAASTPGLLSKTKHGRPALPLDHNDMLTKNSKVYPVKEQTLTLEHPEPSERIVIFRQKVPTPKGVSGHIIRRTDTDAVSASSLFRAAYPHASNEAEAAEISYVTSKYDTIKAGREDEDNGAGRLTGTWVPLHAASDLIEAYGLSKWAKDLLTYESENPIPVSPRLVKATNGDVNAAMTSPEPQVSDSPAPTRAAKRSRVRSPPAAEPVPLPDVGAAAPAVEAETAVVESVVEEPVADVSGPETETITVEQDVVADNITGATTETTTVEVAVPASTSAEEQIAESKRLVEQLKADRLLAQAEGQADTKKRSRDDIEQEEAETEAALPVATRPRARSKRSWFGRGRASPPPSGDQQRSGSRQYLAWAGLAVVGAATAAAPYIFS